jgi:signal transduction histidine kinase
MNAIKFSKNGKIVEMDAHLHDENMTRISVKDQGVGMKPEKIETLFRLDTNISYQGTAGESGTGIGLILCKEFVEYHKGIIWAESELGKGSTFYFTIPKA